MAVRNFSSVAVATSLTGSITASSSTITVAAAVGYPTAPFTIIVDEDTASEELMEVTAVSGTTFTVTRGVDSTTAVSHTAGATVKHGVSARDFREANTHVNATSGTVHGINISAVVTLTDAQTLTNKNLASGTNTFPSTLLTTNGSQTVTYKDLTSGTNIFPSNFATTDTAQTLTNKTLTYPIVTVDTNSQSGTTYTFVLADGSKIVEFTSASAVTATVPPNSSVAYPIGTQILVTQYGAGQVTLAAGSGVTLRSNGTKLKLNGQYAQATLIKRGTDEWIVSGNLVA